MAASEISTAPVPISEASPRITPESVFAFAQLAIAGMDGSSTHSLQQIIRQTVTYLGDNMHPTTGDAANSLQQMARQRREAYWSNCGLVHIPREVLMPDLAEGMISPAFFAAAFNKPASVNPTGFIQS